MDNQQAEARRTVGLNFDDLQLNLASFEVRFEGSFLHWDRSGIIFTDLLQQVPELKLKHAEPNKIIFGTAQNQESQFSLQAGTLALSTALPDKKLERFASLAGRFTEIAAKHLDLSRYSRVGLRTSFLQEFEKPQSAVAAVVSTGLIQLQQSKQFGIDAEPVSAEYSIRREDGKNGFTLWLKAETVKVESEPPFGLGRFMKVVNETRHQVNLDVDCFIMAPVLITQLRVVDWIAQTFHIIKRDGRSLVGGR